MNAHFQTSIGAAAGTSPMCKHACDMIRYMKQTSGFISTYSADTFGVCSALFELGGMIVMHDASGCNSTYTTHDEPRWYDIDSMVYISGLSEIEAIMGDDGKLIDDVANAAKELSPKFIAIAGTPIPAMTGFDAEAAARVIENRTGIRTFGFRTTGMRSYIYGASEAFCALAGMVQRNMKEKRADSVNILGLTPLDFSVNGSDRSIKKYYEDHGYEIISSWAMGSSLEEIRNAAKADFNIVVSETGINAAVKMLKEHDIPFKVGIPIGGEEIDITSLFDIENGKRKFCSANESYDGCDCIIIGEAVCSYSLAEYFRKKTGRKIGVIVSTDSDEDEIARGVSSLGQGCTVIADPLFKPVLPKSVRFISLPHEAFSGRIFRNEIPDLISDTGWLKECIRKADL